MASRFSHQVKEGFAFSLWTTVLPWFSLSYNPCLAQESRIYSSSDAVQFLISLFMTAYSFWGYSGLAAHAKPGIYASTSSLGMKYM